MNTRDFLNILHIAERLKDTPRHCTTSKRRVESVAEHSWRVALMASLLRNELPDVDIDKIESEKPDIQNFMAGLDRLHTDHMVSIMSAILSSHVALRSSTLPESHAFAIDASIGRRAISLIPALSAISSR